MIRTTTTTTRSALWIFLIAARSLVVSASVATGVCDLDCPTDIGAKCVFGDSPAAASVVGSSTTSTGTGTQQARNSTGMHCSCPEFYTGVQCELPYESCGSDSSSGNSGTSTSTSSTSQPEHVCYHGGVCQSGEVDGYGNMQLFCNCAKAVNAATGTPFVGKYCEFATVATCSDDDSNNAAAANNPDSYCFNGGVCNSKYPAFGEPCLCSGSHKGPRCEYTNGDDSTTVVAPQSTSGGGTPSSSSSTASCTLDCGTGGTCVKGQPSAAELAVEYHYWDDEDTTTTTPDMYCQCTDAWDGPACDIAKIPCGDYHCFHGAECLTKTEGGAPVHHCDCSQASTDGTASYAGRFCQYKATAYCNTKDPGLSGLLFCVNDGTCRDNEYEGCDCPTGYTGFSCEFRTSSSSTTPTTGTTTTGTVEVVNETFNTAGSNTTTTNGTTATNKVVEEGNDFGLPVVDSADVVNCSMACINGGTCRHGQKELGAGLDVIANHTRHLNAAVGTSDEFEHCVCPSNFAGTLCETPLDTCGEGKFHCLHGGKCVDLGDEQLCDCDQADSPLATFFAGNHCEHPVNDICTQGLSGRSSSSVTFSNAIPGTSLSFCVNGGKCKATVAANEPHPGCHCEEGFLGPHCELRESAEVPTLHARDPYVNNQQQSDYGTDDGERRSGFEVALLVLSVAAIVMVSVFSVSTYIRRRKQQRNNAITSSLNWSSNHFKDRAPEVNIAPMQRRGSTLSASDPYEDATQEAFARSSRDPIAAHLGSAAAKRAAAAVLELMDNTEPSSPDEDYSDNDSFPDDLCSGLKIDIGPPIDEDGHELHNVEIV